MKKKYLVRLSEEERIQCKEVVKKLKGSSQKVVRAQILLKSDIDGPNWTDDKIAEALSCSRRAVEQVRERLVTQGFEITLNGKRPINPPRAKLLSGEQEAALIAMRLGSPPSGYGSWTLNLLKNEMIALEVVQTISQETIRTTLKKTDLPVKRLNIG